MSEDIETLQQPVMKVLRKKAIMAVLVIDELDSAIPLATALVEGGISAIELALRTPCALEAIKTIKYRVPDMMIGAGTVLERYQVDQAKEAGADFAFSPGLTCEVVERAMDVDLPFVLGICTPSDIEKAINIGCDTLKFFPAEPLGGVNYLKCISAPFDHLGLKYIPLGRLSEDMFTEYYNLPSVLAVGGSWMCTRDLIAEKNWTEIRNRAKRTSAKVFR